MQENLQEGNTLESTLFLIFTGFPYLLLFAWLIYSIYLIRKAGKDPKNINIYVFESIPNVFTTIGILGTFLGITHGLLFFETDADKLSSSISDLLAGLKIAFLTSIWGISGSLVFSQLVKWRLNTVDELAPKIKSDEAKALFKVIDKSQEVNNTLQRVLEEINRNNKLAIENNQQLINSIFNTNTLLREKFDEFARLLAENNSRALVEAMMGVIEDFNGKFTEMISSLVTKNFEELNESIQNLNSWQEENMAQIETLIKLYYSTAEKMQLSASELEKITNNTNQLIGNGGLLSKLIKELQNVIIEENQFEKMSINLLSSSNNMIKVSQSLEKTSEEYEDTKQQITTWLNREKGIQETVLLFTEKLNDFEVADIKELDTSFNRRLSTTFQSFDKLFKEYLEYLDNRNKK